MRRRKAALAKYLVKDPWRSRLRNVWAKYVVCPVRGHDPITKMDGTVLCRRH